jgi:hypothetical protein
MTSVFDVQFIVVKLSLQTFENKPILIAVLVVNG